MSKYVRFLLGCLLGGAGLGALLYVCGWILRPALPTAPVAHAPEEVAEVERLRDVSFDPENLPRVQVEVDYSAGPSAPWFPQGESPILADLVAEGKLPPVAERTGPEPVVLQGVDGLGNYGGTWIRAANAPGDVSVISWRLSGANLVRWSPLGYPIVPHVAKSWESSPDQREWTFHLRRGMRWSDGAPFTADDIMYWWQEENPHLNETRPIWMRVAGQDGEVVKVDDYTVKFTFPEPNGVLLERLTTTEEFLTPRHYLRQFHPQFGDQNLIKAAMAAKGLGTARALYYSMKDIRNPDHPRLWPWVYRTYKATPPEGFVRNPFYFAVDAAGRQLPYVDRILFEIKSAQLIPLAAAAGDLTMQARHIRYDDYTMLMEQRKVNHYQVYHWFSAVRSAWTLWPNINRAHDTPEGTAKAALLADKRFRQALSLALNRPQIIAAEYNNVGEPSQIEPGRESDFHSEKLGRSFIEYDPARANRLLDEIGLTRRDSEGMRLAPGGERVTFYIDATDFTGPGPAQFIVDDWEKVGVRAVPRERSRPLFTTEKSARKHDFTVWTGESEFNPMVEPRSFLPTNTESHGMQAYALWYGAGGLYGNPEAGKRGGLEPPPLIRHAMELLDQARATSDRATQVRLFQEIAEIAAENVWSISIATPPPQLAVVKEGFRNVPRNVLFGASYATPANAGVETFFFDHPADSAGAIAQVRREMTETTPPPDAISTTTLKSESGTWLSTLLRSLVVGVFALGILLAGVRHPYIGRRILIMIPTLFIISVITFYIIQLPPGSFVDTKILQLKLTGDESAIQEVERLRESFHLDEPVWSQYARWMGLRWFGTFSSGDKGLLQGEMGRSMETSRSVNDIVGDRVLLTVLVSLGTILFTWVMALPIGIYSAVKQYTLGDYVLTFLGFIGMCVPNFLLAIMLMYWSGKYLGINVTGLFSPEYSAAPEWTWGKVIDLLKHVWVPIVVIGIGGTAGMIRIMRGNLLDELGKPYVTTARAKGVRPFKLLMKYPVRLALNPFISGIGHIFPALISGGAIVAIVLSLPMVGPLMLQGLTTQDTYLAGSMLMVLSMLSVFGTLVSDLLLLWLDPRIRMEGGK